MRARAFTLIEVVASLALIAGTVTALLQIQSQALVQLRALEEQQAAADLAHELIAHWKLNPSEAASRAQGSFDAQPGWSWIRTSQPYSASGKLQLEQTTLVIRRVGPDGQDREVTSFVWLESKDPSRGQDVASIVHVG